MFKSTINPTTGNTITFSGGEWEYEQACMDDEAMQAEYDYEMACYSVGVEPYTEFDFQQPVAA